MERLQEYRTYNNQFCKRVFDAMQIMFNSWSDGGSWSGNMTRNAAAYFQMQWIEILFNSTDPVYPARQGVCQNVCSVDVGPNIGQPVLLNGKDGEDYPLL